MKQKPSIRSHRHLTKKALKWEPARETASEICPVAGVEKATLNLSPM